MLSQRQIEILEGRGFDIETLVRYGVSGCADRSDAWVEIPYIEGGQRVNTKRRTIYGDKKFDQDAGGVKCFWNVDCLSDESIANQPLIICEGEFDALSAIQAGFPRTVSVPDGAPAVELGDKETLKYTFLDRVNLSQVQQIILATDGDGPGANLLNDLSHRLGRARCKFLRYPKGCKDLNDALRTYGPRGVVETINRAQWVKVPGIARMSELPPLREQPLFSTGIAGMDPHFRIRPGDLSIVVGIPGHGKTSVINAICGHMATAHNWVIGVASFEQRPQIDMRRNFRTLHSGRKVVDMDDSDRAHADKWIDEHFAIMVPDFEDEVDLPWMLERCQAAIVQYGAKLIVIDPVNEMDHVRPKDMNETDYIGFMLKSFKRMAFNRQVHIMLAIHPAKPVKVNGEIPIPTLYDCAGSAHYFNKPDVGLIVHRQSETDTLLRVAKSKYHDVIGRPGDVHAKFNINTGRYESLTQTPGHWQDGN